MWHSSPASHYSLCYAAFGKSHGPLLVCFRIFTVRRLNTSLSLKKGQGRQNPQEDTQGMEHEVFTFSKEKSKGKTETRCLPTLNPDHGQESVTDVPEGAGSSPRCAPWPVDLDMKPLPEPVSLSKTEGGCGSC